MKLPKLVNHKSLIINRRKGFTLIELLIVITIIGILVSAGTYSWQSAQIKARDSRRKTDLKVVQQAVESYYNINGHYPPLIGTPPSEWVGWCSTVSHSTNNQLLTALVPTYLAKMPTDPLVSAGAVGDYVYGVDGVGRYSLYAKLENAKDPDINGPYGMSFCGNGTTLNYKVTNP